MKQSEPTYWPFYCEENVWHLCEREATAGAYVVFISNPARAVALWFQRAARDGKGPVIWDYHVILVRPGEDGWEVIDLDTNLGERVELGTYLERTFVGTKLLPPEHLPMFRVISADRFHDAFSSDRSHMRRADGSYSAPPPPWPAIGSAPNNLMGYVDVESEGEGQVVDLDGLGHFFEEAARAG